MNRIRLIPIDKRIAELLEDPDGFENTHSVRVGESIDLIRPVVQQTLALFERLPRDAHWGCYLVADGHAGQIVGSCGFKDGPNADREVEIAYYTFPHCEGKGYATEMARRLVEMALQISEVQRVIAHTLPEENASTEILKKIGMRFAGEVMDPEDGRVWKWEYVR